jgi:hypothetical protein
MDRSGRAFDDGAPNQVAGSQEKPFDFSEKHRHEDVPLYDYFQKSQAIGAFFS